MFGFLTDVGKICELVRKLMLVLDAVCVDSLYVCVCVCVLGRSYLSKNSELIAALITCLKTETEDVLTQDHALACLQRLSLRYECFISLFVVLQFH